MSEIQLKATNVENKPVRIGDLPIIKTNILENAGQMDKGVVGGYNGAFPLTAASEGGIYLLPSTGKFYVCETAYNGAQISAPNSNFVDLSVVANADRLNKLFKNYSQQGWKVLEIGNSILAYIRITSFEIETETFVKTNIKIPDVIKEVYSCFGNIIYHNTHYEAAAIEVSVDVINRYVTCFFTKNTGSHCYIYVLGEK